MFGVKDINEYCDYVFDELTDMKDKLNEMVDKANDLSSVEKMSASENIFGHLNELSDLIDSKLQAISSHCPEMKSKIGESTWEHRKGSYVGTDLS